MAEIIGYDKKENPAGNKKGGQLTNQEKVDLATLIAKKFELQKEDIDKLFY